MCRLLTAAIALLCVSYGFAQMPPGFGGPGGPGGPGGDGPGFDFPNLENVPNRQELMMCAQPVIGYVFSQMGNMGPKGNMEITQQQFTEGCTVGKNLVQCLDNWVGSLTVPVSPDVRDLLKGTNKILETCNEPQAFEKVKQFKECGKKLESSQNQCREYELSKKRVEDKFKNAAPLTVLKEVRFMDDLCCGLKTVSPCVKGKIQQLCTPADLQFFQSMDQKLNTEFKCAGRTASCPPVSA